MNLDLSFNVINSSKRETLSITESERKTKRG